MSLAGLGWTPPGTPTRLNLLNDALNEDSVKGIGEGRAHQRTGDSGNQEWACAAITEDARDYCCERQSDFARDTLCNRRSFKPPAGDGKRLPSK